MYSEVTPFTSTHLDRLQMEIVEALYDWLECWCSNLEDVKSVKARVFELSEKSAEFLQASWKPNLFSLDTFDSALVAVGDDGGKFGDCLFNVVSGHKPSEITGKIISTNELSALLVSDLTSRLFGAELRKVGSEPDSSLVPGFFVRHRALNRGCCIEIKCLNSSLRMILPSNTVKVILFGTPKPTQEKFHQLEEIVNDKSVTVKAVIEGLKLSYREIKTLQVGDVISNRIPKTEQISIVLGKSRLEDVSIKLGNKDDKRAISFSSLN